YQGRVRIKELAFETNEDYQKWRRQARSTAKQALAKDEFLLWLGGNHMSVLPVLEELGGMKDSLVVQLDAHLDVYNLPDPTKDPPHGNFLLHADAPLPQIVHVGHRDLFLPERTIAKPFRAVIPAEELTRDAAAVSKLAMEAASAKRIWIDID